MTEEVVHLGDARKAHDDAARARAANKEALLGDDITMLVQRLADAQRGARSWADHELEDRRAPLRVTGR